MSDFGNRNQLERALNLKQLQINRLLNITQAINSNVSAEGLYNMYNSFLGWEMGIERMVLYIKNDDAWSCASFIGVDEKLLTEDIPLFFSRYTRLTNIQKETHPLLAQFEVVIPVRHKDSPIAYVFIGGFGEDEDMFSKIQFITTITNIIAVAIENKRLFKRQLEQERLKREMELASEMQLMLVPAVLPQGDYYQLASIYKPQIGVGGDYFDFLDFDDNKFAFCVADISGKGVAAALLMANFQANLHSLIATRPRIADFVRDLNQAVYRITHGDRFITFFFAEFDEKTRMLHYVNAGHNPPFLLMNNDIQLLKKGCTILGSFSQLPSEVEVGSVYVEQEAMILCYTDGLTDLTDRNGAFITDDLLKNFLRTHRHHPPQLFNKLLYERIETFRDTDEDYPDDFTVLTCKILVTPP